MIYTLNDKQLETEGEVFIADNAVLIGSVRLGNNASVWFNTVIRADNEPVVVGENTNIQDGSVLHVDHGFPLTIGRDVTVGHMVMLHGCTIGDNTLIGMGATVLNGARIGKNCLIGANAFVPEGKEIPDNSVVFGSPGKVVREVSEKHMALIKMSAMHYVENGKRYREQLKRDPRFS